jgi:superoxide dismutase
MIPSSLQTSLKVAISGSLAYAIAQFFGFSFTFISSFIAGIFSMVGPGMAWFAFPQYTLIFGLTSILAVIEAYLLGNNYISMFINILFASALWYYLQFRGLVFGSFGLAIKMPAIII